MNEHQIANLLKSHPHTSPYFKGVFARDELPKRTEPGSIYIVNHSVRNEVGTHWILLFITNAGVPLYFDTAGLPAIFPEYLAVLEPYPFYVYNAQKIQSERSRSCGLYCVIISLYLSRGLTLYEARDKFTDDLGGNEERLAAFVLKEFNYLFQRNGVL
jgi:hypothetical protein